MRLAKEGNNCDNEPELIYLGKGSKNEVTGHNSKPPVLRKAARRRRKERKKENRTLKGVMGTKDVCRKMVKTGYWHHNWCTDLFVAEDKDKVTLP